MAVGGDMVSAAVTQTLAVGLFSLGCVFVYDKLFLTKDPAWTEWIAATEAPVDAFMLYW